MPLMNSRIGRTPARLLGCLLAFGPAPLVCSQALPPNYDFDFVTVGAPANPPYNGPDPYGYFTGRGSVPYEYRIGRFEITTGDWLDFINVYGPMGDPHGFGLYTYGGFEFDPAYQGPGYQWRLRPGLPNAAMVPVRAISWRNAARYCNWLHNDRASTPEAIVTGAYDTTLFGWNPKTGNTLTDPPTHLPGARFWIPTLDEWLKAVYYDPDRFGPGQPGWWLYPNRSDEPPIPGAPGVGQTSAGWKVPLGYNEWDIPAGSYPDTLTPWGLLDASGGVTEWMEDFVSPLAPHHRLIHGAPAGSPNWSWLDQVYALAGDSPGGIGSIIMGVRLATSIPAPPSMVIVLCVSCSLAFRRRRDSCASHSP